MELHVLLARFDILSLATRLGSARNDLDDLLVGGRWGRLRNRGNARENDGAANKRT
jgi:hypothetical protein